MIQDTSSVCLQVRKDIVSEYDVKYIMTNLAQSYGGRSGRGLSRNAFAEGLMRI